MKKLGLFIFSISILALASCGDIDGAFSNMSGNVYKANARIDGVSLDDSSILRQGAEIEPYFLSLPANDIEVRTLTVYFTTENSVITGEKVVYRLASDVKKAEDSEESAAKDDNSKDNTDKTSETQAKEAEKPKDTQEKEAVDAEKSAEQPAETKIITEHTVVIESFAGILPSFKMDNLPEGRLTAVFETASAHSLLARVEKPVYYVGAKDFSLNNINIFAASGSGAASAFSTGERILLEAQFATDDIFETYVIWRDGAAIFYEDYAKNGAASFLWDVPFKAGFRNISAEVLPVRPAQTEQSRIKGDTTAVSIAISDSVKQSTTLPLPADLEKSAVRYRLAGSLAAEAAGADALTLKGKSGAKPVWQGIAGTYGVSINANNTYTFPKRAIAAGGKNPALLSSLLSVYSAKDGVFWTSALCDSEGISLLSVECSIENGKLLLRSLPAYNEEDEEEPPLEKMLTVPTTKAPRAITIQYSIDAEGAEIIIGAAGETASLFAVFPPITEKEETEARKFLTLTEEAGGSGQGILTEAAFVNQPLPAAVKAEPSL